MAYVFRSAPTIVSLTNHSYFNLNGHNGNSIMDQELVTTYRKIKALIVYDYVCQTAIIRPET